MDTINNHEAATHFFATLRVAKKVADRTLDPAALGDVGFGQYGWESREFSRRAAECDGAMLWREPQVAVVDGSGEIVGYTTMLFVYRPAVERLTVLAGDDEVEVTSTFDNGRWLALRIRTSADPAGVSGSSEALYIDRMAIGDGFSGLHVRSDLLPIDVSNVSPDLVRPYVAGQFV